MSERVVIGDAELYLADCLEVLPTLAQVDAVITDPPYSEKTHKGARTTNGSAYYGSFVDHPDRVVNEIVFHSMDVETIREVLRLAAPKRWAVLTIDWRYCLPLEAHPPDGMEFIRFGVWEKPRYCPQFTGDRPATGWEAIAILHAIGRKRWNGGGTRAVWTANNEHGSPHPAAKPLSLMHQLVELFTDPYEVILDPFMGSGTTGVACAQTGRRFIGVEIEPGYFEIAVKRIEAAYAQPRLPLAEPDAPAHIAPRMF